MIDLSIIIINYNTFELTCNCLRSIFKYTEGVSFEIILVDNNSTECNADLFVEKFPSIQLVKNEENVGFAKGNNVGLTKAKAKTILLLNSDVEIRENAISRARESLHRANHENVGVVTGKLLFPDGCLQHNCGRFPSIRLQLVELFRLQKLLPSAKAGEVMLGGFFAHNRPVNPDWIWGTFFMFKRDILQCFPQEKLSETYFMYCEDMEWCWMIRNRWKIFFDPSVQVVHIGGASTIAFFGENLSSLIKNNFRDFVVRQKGRFLAHIFFTLQRILYHL